MSWCIFSNVVELEMMGCVRLGVEVWESIGCCGRQSGTPTKYLVSYLAIDSGLEGRGGRSRHRQTTSSSGVLFWDVIQQRHPYRKSGVAYPRVATDDPGSCRVSSAGPGTETVTSTTTTRGVPLKIRWTLPLWYPFTPVARPPTCYPRKFVRLSVGCSVPSFVMSACTCTFLGWLASPQRLQVLLCNKAVPWWTAPIIQSLLFLMGQ